MINSNIKANIINTLFTCPKVSIGGLYNSFPYRIRDS